MGVAKNDAKMTPPSNNFLSALGLPQIAQYQISIRLLAFQDFIQLYQVDNYLMRFPGICMHGICYTFPSWYICLQSSNRFYIEKDNIFLKKRS